MTAHLFTPNTCFKMAPLHRENGGWRALPDLPRAIGHCVTAEAPDTSTTAYEHRWVMTRGLVEPRRWTPDWALGVVAAWETRLGDVVFRSGPEPVNEWFERARDAWEWLEEQRDTTQPDLRPLYVRTNTWVRTSEPDPLGQHPPFPELATPARRSNQERQIDVGPIAAFARLPTGGDEEQVGDLYVYDVPGGRLELWVLNGGFNERLPNGVGDGPPTSGFSLQVSPNFPVDGPELAPQDFLDLASTHAQQANAAHGFPNTVTYVLTAAAMTEDFPATLAEG